MALVVVSPCCPSTQQSLRPVYHRSTRVDAPLAALHQQQQLLNTSPVRQACSPAWRLAVVNIAIVSPLAAARTSVGRCSRGVSKFVRRRRCRVFARSSSVVTIEQEWHSPPELNGIMQVASRERLNALDLHRHDGSVHSDSYLPEQHVNIYTVSKDPSPCIDVIPDLLDDADVSHLLELSKRSWIPSQVANDGHRTSWSSELRPGGQTPRLKNIELRIASLAGMNIDYLEPLSLVRYEPGQLFRLHHDGDWRPKTVFIYLNDLLPGDGGETVFPELGFRFTPRKGCAVMWSNTLGGRIQDLRTVHEGRPTATGIKYGVNCFFGDRIARMGAWADEFRS